LNMSRLMKKICVPHKQLPLIMRMMPTVLRLTGKKCQAAPKLDFGLMPWQITKEYV